VRGTHQVTDLKDWDPSWVKPQPSDASLVVARNNNMHDNVMDGGGYGFVVGGGCYATAQDNLFDNNRHAVAASGKAYSGYVARFTTSCTTAPAGQLLQPAFRRPRRRRQRLRRDGGTYFDISFNTVRGDQGYYVVKTRPVLMLRGRPTSGCSSTTTSTSTRTSTRRSR
jgi:hypothetical protein